jgi:O-antigen biosynthesis protein
MWGLYGWLLAKGEIVFLNASLQVPAVGIYPEIYSGNEMNATTVVRYILNTPGVMGRGIPGTTSFIPGPTTFPVTDKLYYFSRLFGYTADENHYMFLPIINLKIFKDQKRKRTKICYLIAKGQNKQQHPKGSIELTREISQDQQGLADVLNECHTLYCYDKLTAMMEVARLCGVKVKYFGDYEEEELKKYEPGLDGISFGLNEDKPLHTPSFRDHYIEMVKLFEERLDRFIEETQ